MNCDLYSQKYKKDKIDQILKRITNLCFNFHLYPIFKNGTTRTDFFPNQLKMNANVLILQ